MASYGLSQSDIRKSLKVRFTNFSKANFGRKSVHMRMSPFVLKFSDFDNKKELKKKTLRC